MKCSIIAFDERQSSICFLMFTSCCLVVVGYGWYILIRSVWRLIKKLIKYIRSGNFMK